MGNANQDNTNNQPTTNVADETTQNVTAGQFAAALANVDGTNEARDFIARTSSRMLAKFARTIAESNDPTEPFSLGVLRWYLDCEPAEMELFSLLVDVATETGFIQYPDSDVTARVS